MTSRTRSTERTTFLSDVLTTAVEGGIGYWSRIYDSERGPDGGWLSITIADHEEHGSDYASGRFGFLDHDLFDAAVKEGKVPTMTVDLDKVAHAIGLIVRGTNDDGKPVGLHPDYVKRIAGASAVNDADLDAADCDAIVQVAALGSVVYG